MSKYKCSDVTMDQIKAVSMRLFLEKGYDRTTVREICRESGTSLSRLNYHFRSKAELASEICKDFVMIMYSEIVKLKKVDRRTFILKEAVSLRVWIDLLLGRIKTPVYTFLHDMAVSGILAETFADNETDKFVSVKPDMKNFDINVDKTALDICSILFSSSLCALDRVYEKALAKFEGNEDVAANYTGRVCSALFMQFIDFPHDAQALVLDYADRIYPLLDIQVKDFRDIKVNCTDMDLFNEYLKEFDEKVR